MAVQTIDLPDLVIPNGTSTSNAVRSLDNAVAVSISSPAALTSTTITIQVEPTSTGTSFVTLLSGGTSVVIESVNVGIVINPFPYRQLRLTASAAEGAARTFRVRKTEPI